MPIPANQMRIGEGRHPNGQPGASFFIGLSTIEQIEADGPEWKHEDARFIREAVKEPDAIFRGLGRENETESLCYSVRLTADPDEPDNAIAPAYGKVFLVFARIGVGGYVVSDWSWRDEDADAPGHPLSWHVDFTERTWNRP